MTNDQTLRDKVAEFDPDNKYYRAILYVCIEAGANIFAIMTVNHDCLCFYLLNGLKFSLKIENMTILPYENILQVKNRKFLSWNNLTFSVKDGNIGKPYKLKVMISAIMLGIKKQRENLDVLFQHLKSKNIYS